MASEPITFGVGSDGQNFTFTSWEELISWANRERANWEWLAPGDGRTDVNNWASTVRNQWNQISNQLVQLQGSGAALSAAVQHLAPVNHSGQLLVSDTRDGKLVLDIRTTAGEAAAAFAYAFLKRG